MAKKAATPKKPPTKTEILTRIAEATDLTKKQVAAVFDALADEIGQNLGRRGPGAFAIPGLLKIEKKKVPARKAKKGVLILEDRPFLDGPEVFVQRMIDSGEMPTAHANL